MNMRKIIAVLSAALLLCAAIPMGALSVAAAPGDVILDINFDDGGNGGFERSYNENGYIVFDATTADWQNTYAYKSGFQTNVDYVVTFKAKANKDTTMNFKINDNWGPDAAAFTVNVTTEWQEFEGTINMASLSGAIVMFSSNAPAADAAIYYIDDLKIVEKKVELEVGKIINGDFENGSEGWTLNSSASIENGALKLDNSGQWSEAAMAEIAVEVGTEYTLSWKSQRVSGSGAFLMYILKSDNSNHPTTAGQNWMNETSGEWVTNTLTFTAEEANLKLKLSAEVNDPGIILIDDIALIKSEGIWNTNFNDGDKKFSGGEVVAEGPDGSNCYKWSANGGWSATYIVVKNVDPSKDYTVTMKVKASVNGTMGVTIQNGDWGSYWNAPGFAVTTEWKDVIYTIPANSIPFNVGNILFKFQDVGQAMDLYVDDLVISEGLPEQPEQPEKPLFENGDFENGKEGWGLNQSTVIDAAAAKNGNNGAHLKGNGGWGSMLERTFDTEAGQKYELSFWIKAIASGTNVQLKDQTWQGASIEGAGGWFNKTEWTKVTYTFTAVSNKTYLNFCGSGSAAEELYVDDVVLEKIQDPSFDGYIYNGDFETGEVHPWDNLWGSCPTVEIVEGGLDSDYALHIVSKKWNHVRQTAIPVEPNTWYKVTAWAKNTSDMILLVKDGGDSANLNQTGMTAGEEWTEFTGVFYTGDYTTIIISLMGGENDEVADKYGTFDNVSLEVTEEPVCEHEYDDCLDADCNLCGETREPGHKLTYHEAVVATNCQETGHDEYWYCENCGCYFGDAEASWQHNPGWLFTTGECVRPEGIADCATVTCETCGNEIYGYGEHDVLVCQGGTCSKCGENIEGVGCQNFDTPACEDGVCYYCGGFVAGFGHENGAWAACCDGECAYGCGLIYPATEDHIDEDGDGYCDTCWNHLNCVDEDGDGWCDICWEMMPDEPVEILYGDADGDGEITLLDASLLSQYLGGYDVTLDEIAADADGDGEITLLDASLLSQYLGGYDVTLGPQG